MSDKDRCSNCGSEKHRCYKRTKGKITYMVYVCEICRNVVRREIKTNGNCDTDV